MWLDGSCHCDAVAFRVAGRYSDVDGYIRNTLTNQDEPGRQEIIGRVSMLAETGPATIFAKFAKQVRGA